MNREEVKELLLELDKQFSDDAQRDGAIAWAENFAEDGVLVSGGHRPYIKGRDNVSNAISALYALEKLVFYWEPQIVDVSDDLTMGYTSGIYTRRYSYQGKNYSEKGKYTSIWRKYSDRWKIILDIGNEESEQSS